MFKKFVKVTRVRRYSQGQQGSRAYQEVPCARCIEKKFNSCLTYSEKTSQVGGFLYDTYNCIPYVLFLYTHRYNINHITYVQHYLNTRILRTTSFILTKHNAKQSKNIKLTKRSHSIQNKTESMNNNEQSSRRSKVQKPSEQRHLHRSNETCCNYITFFCRQRYNLGGITSESGIHAIHSPEPEEFLMNILFLQLPRCIQI